MSTTRRYRLTNIIALGAMSFSLLGFHGVFAANPSTPLNHAFPLIMVDAKSGWAFMNGDLEHTDDGAAEWNTVTPQASELLPGDTRGISTPSPAVAWMLLSDPLQTKLLYTDNGGKRWRVSAFAGHLGPISAINANDAWVMGYISGSGADTEDIVIYRTTDGGRHWSTMAETGSRGSDLPGYGDKTWLKFFNRQDGVIGGNTQDGVPWLYVTRDGGSHWQWASVSGLSNYQGYPLSFGPFWSFGDGRATMVVQAGQGGMDGQYGLYQTVDDGLQWSPIGTLPGDPTVDTLAFAGTNTAWVATNVSDTETAINRLYRSTNGGRSWSVVSDSPPPEALSLQFFSPTVGYANPPGQLWITRDGGVRWTRMHPVIEARTPKAQRRR